MSSENKNRKISVSHKIFACSVTVMAALVAIFAIISVTVTMLRSESDSYNDMYNSGTVISGIVSDYMRPKTGFVSDAARNDTVIDYICSLGSATSMDDMMSASGYEAVQEILDRIAASDIDIVSAWLVSEKGGAVLGSGAKYVPYESFGLSGRYWNNNSLSAGEVICTSKSNSIFDGSTGVVSVISPVCFDGSVVGFAGIEVDISSISRIMEQYSLNSGCYPIISCNYGSVLYSPSSETFSKKFDIRSGALMNIIIQAESYHGGIDSYSEGRGFKDTVHFTVDNISVPGWSIIIVFDSEVINGGIYEFLLIEIVSLVCLSIIALIVLRHYIDKETALISCVSESLQAIANGSYKRIETDYSVKKELTDSIENLNKIAGTLNEKTDIIRQYVSNDILTGLPNRITMYDDIDELMQRCESAEDGRFALMFVDIDNFKWLNETLGHNFGDTVLSTFADGLSKALNKLGKVYRFGGDEFIILVEFGSDYDKIHEAIDSLKNVFSNQMQVMTENIYLKFSMGVSIFPDDDTTVDMLLRDADIALHRAKESGKDRVSFYTNTDKQQNLSKAAIAQQVANALKDGEMYLNFQPIISTESCDIYGFEVLLRWDSFKFGNLSPTEFINVAEETGAIVQIGMWIFESSCRFLKELCEKYRDDIIMSVNVSPVQLKRADYIENITRVIEITQVKPENIQLEITESTLIDFMEEKNSVIDRINDMGISIALDDFGTGYSSLNYLKNFPIKCLKIDKSFVDKINSDQRDYTITDSIIDLVHNLGIKTVAEGIETVGQYNFLRKMKCDYIQGFLMSKPLDEEDALEFVEMYDALHKPDSNALAEHEKQLADEKKNQSSGGETTGNKQTPLPDELLSK